jgi:hypothetical protein
MGCGHWVIFSRAGKCCILYNKIGGISPIYGLMLQNVQQFRAMFPGLKPISLKLLHKMQLYPFSSAKGAENVAFFAGFVASCAREGGALTLEFAR